MSVQRFIRDKIQAFGAALEREEIAQGLEGWARLLETQPVSPEAMKANGWTYVPDRVRAWADDRALVLRDAAGQVRAGTIKEWSNP